MGEILCVPVLVYVHLYRRYSIQYYDSLLGGRDSHEKRQIGCYGYPWGQGAVSSIVKGGHSRGYGYGLTRIFPFLRVVGYENPSILCK